MGVASIHVEDRKRYVFFRWEGKLTEAEIISVATQHYPHFKLRNKLYDMNQADLTGLDVASMAKVAEEVSDLQSNSGFPKTAFVARDFSTYSILSRYALVAFQKHVQVEYRVFPAMEDAEEWLTTS